MKYKRVFLIVLDSVGIGEAPDADKFGDSGSNTLKSCSSSKYFDINTMKNMGIFNIDKNQYISGVSCPTSIYGALCEVSNGKDTTTGHWEIAGIISEKKMPTYPDGFPQDILSQIEKATGRGILCNKPYSGTQVIADYGEEQLKTGKLIIYTSADSVLQIAAHNSVVPTETLYEYCKAIRKIMNGKNSVGRIIARPFDGKPGSFFRTSGRHDFSLVPPQDTMLDRLKSNNFDVIGVGKIYDIFAGKGLTEKYLTGTNDIGMKTIEQVAQKDFKGLCFINLVDFDMLYGHRNDVDGYAKALTEFDKWLSIFITTLKNDDLLIITADHGCDPATVSTDHSRERIPLIIYGKEITPKNLGTMNGYSCIGKTILKNFDCYYDDIFGTAIEL